MYAFIMVDPMDPEYSFAATCTDQRIWDQLHDLTPQPGSSSWTVQLPAGVELAHDQGSEVTLTSGSFQNDYAMALASSTAMEPVDAEWAIAGLPLALRNAVAELGVPDANVYEGLLY